MKVLAIDYGSKTIGLAISNNAGTIAFPHGTLINTRGVLARIKKILTDEDIAEIVVGIPAYNTNTPFYRGVREFINTLQTACKVAIHTQDELVSSREAKDRSGQEERHDIAAHIILETYLQTKNPS